MTTIPDAAIEAAARAIFEDGTGDYSWAEMVTEDPTRADIWRGDARRTLLAALPHLTPAPQAEGDVREQLADVIGTSNLVPFYASSQVARSLSLELARAVLSSGLVVPAEIHKVATDALEAGDACDAVGCRALIERDALVAALSPVIEYVNVERNYTTMFGDHHANDVQLVMRDLRLAQAEKKRLRAELTQVTQWHDEVRQECAELRGEADDYLLERDSALAAAEHLHVLWQFARDFARTSGDGPSCECINCRAYRATRANAPSATANDIGDGTNEGDQG